MTINRSVRGAIGRLTSRPSMPSVRSAIPAQIIRVGTNAAISAHPNRSATGVGEEIKIACPGQEV